MVYVQGVLRYLHWIPSSYGFADSEANLFMLKVLFYFYFFASFSHSLPSLQNDSQDFGLLSEMSYFM